MPLLQAHLIVFIEVKNTAYSFLLACTVLCKLTESCGNVIKVEVEDKL